MTRGYALPRRAWWGALGAGLAAACAPPPARGPTCGPPRHGVPAVVHRPGAGVDAGAAARGEGALVVRLAEGTPGRPPVATAQLAFAMPARPDSLRAFPGAEGPAGVHAAPRAPAGAYLLQVRRIGYAQRRDTVAVRAGRADTADVDLEAEQLCAYPHPAGRR